MGYKREDVSLEEVFPCAGVVLPPLASPDHRGYSTRVYGRASLTLMQPVRLYFQVKSHPDLDRLILVFSFESEDNSLDETGVYLTIDNLLDCY